MILGVGHDTCVFSGISFWSSLYVFSLGGRLLNPTKPLWAWTDKIIRQPHAQNQPQPKINLQIRQVKIQMITNGHDFASWKLQTKIYHWTWMHSCWMANADLDIVKPMKSGSVFIEVETKQQCKKSLEDNQATGPFTCKSFTTQNSEFFKICH